MIYLQLFYTFFKIGLFGFGGGYAMLSMIQGEVVTRYGWVSSQPNDSGSYRYQCSNLCRIYINGQCMGINYRYLCSSTTFIYFNVDNQ